MVFIETPTSRAAWKTATGAAEIMSGSIPHSVHPILAIRSARKQRSHRSARLRIGRSPQLRRGHRGHPMPKSYSSSPSCIPVQYPREGAISSRFQDSALKCGMRPRIFANLLFADPLLWCMRNCSKTAPGDTSRRYPHLRQFQGGTEKVGSGRRDLVRFLCHLPRISCIWQSHIIVLADALRFRK
jgi:hypothetical protein